MDTDDWLVDHDCNLSQSQLNVFKRQMNKENFHTSNCIHAVGVRHLEKNVEES
jgi:hypothetical protein